MWIYTIFICAHRAKRLYKVKELRMASGPVAGTSRHGVGPVIYVVPR